MEQDRNQRLIEKNKGSNDDDTVGNILFEIESEDLEDTKKMLTRMWNKRKKLEKENRREIGIEEMPREKKKRISKKGK